MCVCVFYINIKICIYYIILKNSKYSTNIFIQYKYIYFKLYLIIFISRLFDQYPCGWH